VHTVPWNMCGSQVMPGQLGAIEHVDVAALVAPRPLLVESGTDDMIFPVASARATVDRLRTLYATLGAPDDAVVHDVFEGDRFSHACPFARIMEEGLATRLVQVGIRAMNPPQQAQADRFGVEVIDMAAWLAGAATPGGGVSVKPNE